MCAALSSKALRCPREGSAESLFFEPRAENWLDLHYRPILVGRDYGARKDFHMDGATSAIEARALWHYTIKGYGMFRTGDRSVPLTEGLVLVAFEPGRWSLSLPRSSPGWQRLFISFPEGIGHEALRWMAQAFGPIHALPRNSKAVRHAIRLVEMGRTQAVRPASEWSLATYEWLMRWMDEASDVSSSMDIPEKEALNSPLLGVGFSSFKEFANRIGYSRSHLSRKLKRDWGKSPGAALRRSRLSQAARMLRNTSMSIGEIALRVAYSSPTAFIRAFRIGYGVTPLQYRLSKRHHAEGNLDATCPVQKFGSITKR